MYFSNPIEAKREGRSCSGVWMRFRIFEGIDSKLLLALRNISCSDANLERGLGEGSALFQMLLSYISYKKIETNVVGIVRNGTYSSFGEEIFRFERSGRTAKAEAVTGPCRCRHTNLHPLRLILESFHRLHALLFKITRSQCG